MIPDPNATEETPETRIGRLAEEIRNDTPEEPDWLVPGIMYLGGITEVNGREKSGKGYFQTYLLGCLERNNTTIFGPSSVGAVRTMIFTEEPAQSLKEKFDLFDLKQAMVVYHWELAHLPWAEIVEWLVQNAIRLECKLLFIDNISAATGVQDEAGVELSNKVRPLANKAKELGLAVLYDRHQRKSPGKVMDLARGSTSLAGAVDNIVALQTSGEGRERKLTSWGRLMSCNWEKQIELWEDWTGYTLLDGDFRHRILVSRTHWTAADFAEVISVTKDTARAYLMDHPLVERRAGAAPNGADMFLIDLPPDIS